jgi:asparagine synthase (glutamine-hydrolysing)
MCGIFAIFGLKGNYIEKRAHAVRLLKRLRHRGPEYTGIAYYKTEENVHNFLCHERLAIVDPQHGDQPQYSRDNKYCCVANGEIYNFKELFANMDGYAEKYKDAKTDCLVIPNMFEYYEDPGKVANMLSGKFAVICYDTEKNRFYVLRDHVGICPVYLGVGKNGEFYVSNELKSFHDVCKSVEILLPGHYYDSASNSQIRWYFPMYHDLSIIPTSKVDLKIIREKLMIAVRRRLMCDVPLGVLLSGGLDSSLIASVTCRLYTDYFKEHENDILVCKKVNSFCIGLVGSPDLKASREVADFLGTTHHEFTFTEEEGLDAISDVIQAIETYNPTTIRAATPMFLMSRKIKALGIKMVLTGEGSDEVFGGYLYFHKAPNKEEFHRECSRKIQDLYKYDLLRANKSMMAWGIEPRVPFLDKDFVEYNMSYDPEAKMITKDHQNIEKYILR